MAALPIIIDCDPGQDDAINLFLAFASPAQLDVRGVTTVAGNAPLSLTHRNARLLCELAGRDDLSVYAGCPGPMVVTPMHAGHVHGESGIDGLPIYEPRMPVQGQHAVNFIIETCLAAVAAPITLVATGPLTNVATALVMEPGIVHGIARVVLMGGAMREAGNITPSAEFNMRADPHAADIVMRSGLDIVAFGLDVTHQVLTTQTRLGQILALDNPVAEAAHGMLAFFNRYDSAKYGSDGAPLHDACTVAYLLKPELFVTRRCSIQVETCSPMSLGHTAVDFWGVTAADCNVEWAHAVDADALFELVLEKLSCFTRR